MKICGRPVFVDQTLPSGLHLLPAWAPQQSWRLGGHATRCYCRVFLLRCLESMMVDENCKSTNVVFDLEIDWSPAWKQRGQCILPRHCRSVCTTNCSEDHQEVHKLRPSFHQFGVRKPCWDTIQRYTKDLFCFYQVFFTMTPKENAVTKDFVSTWLKNWFATEKSAISAIFAYSRLAHSIFLGATPIRGLQQSAQHPADQAGPNVVAPHQGLDDTEDQHTNLRINGTWWVWVKFLGTHGPTFFSRCCVFNPLPQTIVTWGQ